MTNAEEPYVSGLWTMIGPWSVASEPEFVDGYGVRSGNGPGFIVYQEDSERTAGLTFPIPRIDSAAASFSKLAKCFEGSDPSKRRSQPARQVLEQVR